MKYLQKQLNKTQKRQTENRNELRQSLAYLDWSQKELAELQSLLKIAKMREVRESLRELVESKKDDVDFMKDDVAGAKEDIEKTAKEIADIKEEMK